MKFKTSEWTDNFDSYREIVSEYIKNYHYISWNEAAGDPEPKFRAIEDEMTSTGFVDWSAE